MKLIKDKVNYNAGNLAYRIYEPEGEVKAVVQVSHGMCEYVGRYENYAEHLCANGIVLAGNDHPGHGESAESPDELGKIEMDGALDGLRAMSELLLERYEGKPLILLGHSMGSFLCRLYLTMYAEYLSGAIIMGTSGPDVPAGAGIALANMIIALRGRDHRSKLLKKIAFAGYLKRCGKGADKSAWLTRDSAIVEKYNSDPFCNYIFTANSYYELFNAILIVSNEIWAPNVPTDLPILIISGEDDPVGSYGKGVCKVAGALTHAGARKLTTVIIPGARHEVLNETDKEETYEVIDKWLAEVLAEIPEEDLLETHSEEEI